MKLQSLLIFTLHPILLLLLLQLNFSESLESINTSDDGMHVQVLGQEDQLHSLAAPGVGQGADYHNTDKLDYDNINRGAGGTDY